MACANRLLLLLGAIAVVAVAAGCGSSSRHGGSACGANQYAVDLSSNGATGGIVGSVRITRVHVSSCRLAITVRLAIRRGAELVDSVKGNPATARVDRQLGPAPFAESWVWRNWCSHGTGFALVASVGSATARADVPTTPRCDEPKAPSTLDALAGQAP